MRKKIVPIAVLSCAFTVFSIMPAFATVKTVDYGASWSYGFSNFLTKAYSNVTSSSNWHSSTVVSDDDSSASGAVEPGQTSYASIGMMPWTNPIHFYWNVW